MSNSNGDEENDDEYLDCIDLGDWRSFRKALVDSGISTESAVAEEGYLKMNDDAQMKKEDGSTEFVGKDEEIVDASKGSSVKRPKSVSKANEELLKQQSEELAKEYTDGVWAHEASIVGIVCEN